MSDLQQRTESANQLVCTMSERENSWFSLMVFFKSRKERGVPVSGRMSLLCAVNLSAIRKMGDSFLAIDSIYALSFSLSETDN